MAQKEKSPSLSDDAEKANKTLWDYFKKSENNESAECLLCSSILKISQRSRKGLVTHLKSKHCIDLKSQKSESEPQASTSREEPKCEDDPNPKPKKKARTIESYFIKEYSMEKMISRMISRDGFTFRSFCTSTDLRYLFSRSGFKLPNSPNTIRTIVLKFSDSVKGNMINEFNNLKKQNQKLSLTFDEWTSQKNQRYLNINVHTKLKHFNLGLVRIHGSCTAEHCVRMVEEHLKSFNVNLKNDIIGMTTDGASVMQKVGRLMPCYHQLCYAHGIQLAVVDILYKKNTEERQQSPQEAEEKLSTSDDEDEDYDDDLSEDHALSVTLNLPPAEVVPNYNSLIKKVRKVVKIFKKSPTKNDTYLQKYVKEEHGKNLDLILDCMTRWNSLFDMLERFFALRLSISKALIDIESDIQFTDEEWSKINDLNTCLKPLKLSLEVLCRRDSSLITAETTFKFMLEKLDAQSTVLSTDLATALRARIKQRRTDLTGILIYLQNSSKYEQDLKRTDNTFAMPKKNSIRQEIKKLLERILNSEEGNESEGSDSDGNQEEDVQQSSERDLSLQEELELQLQNESKASEIKQTGLPQLEKVLRKEMTAYESDGTKGKYLTMAYEYLMTLQPTSVEAERAFSAAGYICSTLRSRLNDETISSVCFLRAHFLQQWYVCCFLLLSLIFKSMKAYLSHEFRVWTR